MFLLAKKLKNQLNFTDILIIRNRIQAGPITSFSMTLIMTIHGFMAMYLGWPQYQNAKESPN